MEHEKAVFFSDGEVNKNDGLIALWNVGDKETREPVGQVMLSDADQMFHAMMWCCIGEFDTLEAAIDALMARFDRQRRQGLDNLADLDDFIQNYEGEV